MRLSSCILIGLAATTTAVAQVSLAPTAAPADWENPQIFERNRESPRATLFNFESGMIADTNDPARSSRFRSLDGPWHFHWSPTPEARPRDFFRPDYDVSAWQTIAVPGNMEIAGYGEPIYINYGYVFPMDQPKVGNERNYVGSYRREFDLPAEWQGDDVYVTFGAVASAFYLWVNGHQVGYSESSKNPARFRITDYLRPGRNQIAFQVFKFSDGSYLEDMDFWRLSGPERSVTLAAEPKAAVADFFVRADVAPDNRTGIFTLDVTPTADAATIEVDLLDRGRTVAHFPPRAADGKLTFSARVPHAQLWSAETPYLYQMRIKVRDRSGVIRSVVPSSVGFRSVRVAGNKLLVNGRRVTIRGVNLHEHSMRTGHVVDDATIEGDIKAMKALNINAIRTSHYPNRPYLYDLADRYGMYIVDEANLESHGYMAAAEHVKDPTQVLLGDRPEWRAAHLARMQALVERDKNHPSVIVWSLGNEAGSGSSFQAMFDWAKARDPGRPVQYQAAGLRPPYTDLIVPFYPSDRQIVALAKANPDKPIIMSEYAHAMGNSMGGFADDWKAIRAMPNTQGGFIWDWVDQGLLWTRADGSTFVAYGGDFDPMIARKFVGSRGTRGNFLANGLLGADRTPHPHAMEVRHVYQPVDFARTSTGRIRITNRFDFIDLNRFDLRWSVIQDGSVVASGKRAMPRIAPGATAAVTIPAARGAGERFLDVQMVARAESLPLVAADAVVGWEQFALGGTPAAPPLRLDQRLAPMRFTRSDRSITVSGGGSRIDFDTVLGTMSSWTVDGDELVRTGLAPNFWRGPTDNDLGWRADEKLAIWRTATDRPDTTSVDAQQEGDVVMVTVKQTLQGGAGTHTTHYRVAAGGVDVEADLTLSSGVTADLPRYGLSMTLPERFARLEWYGRGPFENYADRKSAASIGRWSSTAWQMVHDYIRPQETGNVTDVRWLALTDPDGLGLLVEGSPTFDGSAIQIANGELYYDPDINRHAADLHPRSFVTLNVDKGQMGVGGDNAWGALPHKQYMMPPRPYHLAFRLIPILPAGKDR